MLGKMNKYTKEQEGRINPSSEGYGGVASALLKHPDPEEATKRTTGS